MPSDALIKWRNSGNSMRQHMALCQQVKRSTRQLVPNVVVAMETKQDLNNADALDIFFFS